MSYDFNQLTDKEFEQLGIELVSTVLNERIERFKPGKDRGVDGRFFTNQKKEVILQTKHYLISGYNNLVKHIKNIEAKKVQLLTPARYIFITSLPLSRINKAEIKGLFSPYLKTESDIFGQEDLNDILSNKPQIEEKYFKLWISSTNVFNRIVNNAIKGRSEYELKQIKLKSKYYVQTNWHNDALTKLKENNVIIISGEPGIGKTTLAENLCLFFVSKDYEFCAIEELLSEAENIYHPERKQLFYFDDFLGSNYFEAIENKKDSHIMKFIERIKNDKNKIFILTSRTNILNAGLHYSPILYNKKIDENEFLLTIDNFSNLDKAKILYNHIWFSKLNEEFLNEIFQDKRYRQIISHRNFNPRIIEFITDSDRIEPSLKNYWEYVSNTLNNPSEIWSNSFKVQIDEYVRNLVILTVFNGGKIKEGELKDSFDYLIKLEKIKNNSNTVKDFKSTAQLATKSFLNRNQSQDGASFSLFNPSIADFIINEYHENKTKLVNVFLALCTVRSLENLKALMLQKIISGDSYTYIINKLFEDGDIYEKHDDYILLLINELKEDKTKQTKIIEHLSCFTEFPLSIRKVSLFLELLFIFKEKIDGLNADFLHIIISKFSLDEEELKYLMELAIYLKIEDEDLLAELKDEIESYLRDKLEDIQNEVSARDFVSVYYDDYGLTDVHYDPEGLMACITDLLLEEINNFNSEAIELLRIEVENFSGEIDTDKIFDDFLRSPAYDDSDFASHNSPGSFSGSFDPIDDLFDRS